MQEIPALKLTTDMYLGQASGSRSNLEASACTFTIVCVRERLCSAGTWWGYGLVAYGLAIFQSPKKSFRGRNLQENPSNSTERAIFAKFQAPKL